MKSVEKWIRILFFLNLSPVQKEVPLSHNMQDYAYENKILLGQRKITPHRKIARINLVIEVVSYWARMPWQFDLRKDLHPTKFQERPQILVKQSFRDICGSVISYVFLIVWPFFWGTKKGKKLEKYAVSSWDTDLWNDFWDPN